MSWSKEESLELQTRCSRRPTQRSSPVGSIYTLAESKLAAIMTVLQKLNQSI